nr:reverse transcriptase domain-containing protein [Tanacetum cinerariifolium]
MFLGKYFPPSMVTKLRNEITKFRQRPDESLFEAWKRYKISIDRCPNHNMLPVTQIDTFYNGLTLRHRDTINTAARGTFMKRRPEECYDLIENMTAHHNDWDTSAQRSESSSSITSSSYPKIAALKAEMAEINKNLMRVLQVNQQVKEITPSCETCGGPHSYNDCLATVGQTQNVYAVGAYQGASHGQNPPPAYQAPAYQASGYQAPVHQPPIPQLQVVTTNEFTNFMKANDAILKNMQTNMTSLTNSNLELKNMFGQFMKMNTASSSGSGTLPGNTITNPKEDLKGITTRSGTVYQGPTIPTTSSSLPKVVKRETDVTKDTVHPTNNESTKDIQPLVVQTKTPVLNSEPVVAPVSAPKPNQKPSIPFKDALILMPKFGPAIKTLLNNKDKLSELARTPLNEHCSAVLLKKLPEKLGDPGKFFIPCDFSVMDECLALADLGASINLMTLSVWNKLSLPELSPTCMTLKLADRSISRLVGVAEDVFVKVGTFHFLADFVVVDFDADPRLPLILGRSFLKTGRDLIDVFEGELTLRVGKEAITFNLGQTLRYLANYNDMTANRIDVIDMACEECARGSGLCWGRVVEVMGSRGVNSPSKTSIKSLPILRKDLPRIRGSRGSVSKSTTTKLAGKWNVPTLTKTSSATPTGREIERSASLRVIHVGDSSGRESLFHTDNVMRFMLAPRSARAKHSSILEKSHGMKNSPGSPSFSVPLRVVIPFKSSFGLVMVLPGRVPEPEDEAEEEVIELDDSLRWAEVSQSLWWKIFSKKHFGYLLKSVDRIPWQTIKPSGGMMCQGVRKEIQTKGVIGDSVHFDTLGDIPKFVSLIAIEAIGPPRPFKDGWHNSSIVRRSGTGRSPFPSAAISKEYDQQEIFFGL